MSARLYCHTLLINLVWNAHGIMKEKSSCGDIRWSEIHDSLLPQFWEWSKVTNNVKYLEYFSLVHLKIKSTQSESTVWKGISGKGECSYSSQCLFSFWPLPSCIHNWELCIPDLEMWCAWGCPLSISQHYVWGVQPFFYSLALHSDQEGRGTWAGVKMVL